MNKEFYLDIENKLKESLVKTRKNYVLLGSLLIALNKREYYSEVENLPLGRSCKNIYELAKIKFNLCKTSTKNLIAVRIRFGVDDENLKPEFKPYSYTQLVEMLPFLDSQLYLVNPSMSKEDIRALRRSLSKKDNNLQEDEVMQDYTDPEKFQKLNNDKERLAFLDDYRSWGVWKKIPELNLEFYRANLSNGAYIVVGVVCVYDEEKHISGYTYPHVRIIDPNFEGFMYGSLKTYSFDNMTQKDYLSYLKQTKALPYIVKRI